MKRSTKNIINIFICALILICSLCTFFLYTNQEKPNNDGMHMQNMNESGVPPMPDPNGNQPPEKPNNMQLSPNQNQSLNGQVPSDIEKNFNDQPPSIPGEKGNDQGIIEKDNKQNQMNTMQQENNFRFIVFIVLLILEGLLFAGFVVNLFITKCNKISLKQALSKNNKKIIFIISIVVITTIFVVAFSIPMGLFSSQSNKPMQGQNMKSDSQINYNASTTYDTDVSTDNQYYQCSESDCLAVMVINKITATLNNFKLVKTGDSEKGDNTSFYGNNSGIISKDGATLNISNADIYTDASGANGVFCYGGSLNNKDTLGTALKLLLIILK